ncbi:MAG: T9SS type A sorting domain-containing protein [Chitinophagales bacterium]|nr:T9SS type A sorting domain-containing protein [Chitinophagales bacterium]
MKILFAFLLIVFQFDFNFSFGQAGKLDLSFGLNGKVITDINNGSDEGAQDVAIQADGKIVVVGWTYKLDTGKFAIARYNTDGSPDSSFGTNGIVISAIAFGTLGANAVAIQKDDKILVAGSADIDPGINNTFEFAVTRYLTDGKIDSSFGINGLLLIINVSGNSGVCFSIAIQPDDKIVLAGSNFTIVRLNPDGSFDDSFGIEGETIDLNLPASAFSVVVQPDGKIVAGGTIHDTIKMEDHVVIVRYNADGSIDNSFGINGISIAEFKAEGDGKLALQLDEKILAANASWNATTATADFAVLRYNVNGTPDSSFGTNGLVTTASGIEAVATSILVQPDQKIVVAGESEFGIKRAFEIMRYQVNGNLDSTFGTAGKTKTDVGTYEDYGNAIAMQSNGEIVMVGITSSDFGIVRYMNDLNVGFENVKPDEMNFLVYPIPSTGSFIIEMNTERGDEVSINILNAYGQNVFSSSYPSFIGTATFKKEIDLNKLSNGIYFISIQTEKISLQKKIIISR